MSGASCAAASRSAIMLRAARKLAGTVCVALSALVVLACSERRDAGNSAREDAPSNLAITPAAGNAARGAALVRELECSRCHEGTGAPDAPLEKNCTGCHARIESGTLTVDPEDLQRWQTRVRHFVSVPSLARTQGRFRSSWLERFLLEPHDLRPSLDETMPRLRLSPDQAKDLATHLAPHDASGVEKSAGVVERGRRLLETKGCGTCHRMTGVPPIAASAIPIRMPDARLSKAIRLAPDLSLSRERLLPGYLVRWLAKPSAVDPAALMPDIPLTPAEIADIAAYLLGAPLTSPERTRFERLPLLDRPVPFSEVKARVFRKTCWHCHADPDYAIGDGGPGNTGGFGFPPKRVNLAEHESILAGFVDETGVRRSLFLFEPPKHEGRLIEALLARHSEERGEPVAGVRGMPLGLPALPPEEIQLVESWIAQGRPL